MVRTLLKGIGIFLIAKFLWALVVISFFGMLLLGIASKEIGTALFYWLIGWVGIYVFLTIISNLFKFIGRILNRIFHF